jgi:hypothetical protein
MITKHFVEFYSPGTFVHEVSAKDIDSWDVEKACEMAKSIKERHGATPFGFRFITRTRSDEDLDSKVSDKSHMYYLGGTVLTLQDVIDRNDPKDSILISNMRGNGYARIIENTNSWRTVQPLNAEDVVLDWTH